MIPWYVRPIGYTTVEGGCWRPWYWDTTINNRELDLFRQLKKKDGAGFYTFKHKITKIHSLVFHRAGCYFRWDVLNGLTLAVEVPLKNIKFLEHMQSIQDAIWFGRPQ